MRASLSRIFSGRFSLRTKRISTNRKNAYAADITKANTKIEPDIYNRNKKHIIILTALRLGGIERSIQDFDLEGIKFQIWLCVENPDSFRVFFLKFIFGSSLLRP